MVKGIFKVNKPIIGMIHLDGKNLDKLMDIALKDVEKIEKGWIGKNIKEGFCNFNINNLS